jgi:hypothetical protein
MPRRFNAVESIEDDAENRALHHFFSRKAEDCTAEERNAEDCIRRYGAHAIGYGRKIRSEVPGSPSLRIYVPVGAKKPKIDPNCEWVGGEREELTIHDPKTGVPFTYKTDVEEARRVRLLGGQGAQLALDLIWGGEGCSGKDIGTLGGWAWDPIEDRVVLLSAEHVLGTLGQDRIPVHHPGWGENNILIGHVLRSQRIDPSAAVTLDCAIASVDRPDDCRFEVREIGPAIMATATPKIGVGVQKYGSRTNRTYGQIEASYWTGNVDPYGGGEPTFVRSCIRVTPTGTTWSDHGDSGSLVFRSERLEGTKIRPAVGLNFGGDYADDGDDKPSSVGIACRISAVFKALEIQTLSAGILDVLVEQAWGDQTERAKDLLCELHGILQFSDVGQVISDLLNTHRAQFVEALVRNEELRRATAQALVAVIQKDLQMSSVLRRRLTTADVSVVREFCVTMQRIPDDELHAICEHLLEKASSLEGAAIEVVLNAHVTVPGTAADASQDASQPSEEEVSKYLEANELRLIDEYGADSVAVGRSDGAYVVVFGFPPGAGKASPPNHIPPMLVWNRAGLAPLHIQTRTVEQPRPKAAF